MAGAFEAAAKEMFPELFEAHPDLLMQLVGAGFNIFFEFLVFYSFLSYFVVFYRFFPSSAYFSCSSLRSFSLLHILVPFFSIPSPLLLTSRYCAFFKLKVRV